jgi:cobalt/nickel transport system permease protein
MHLVDGVVSTPVLIGASVVSAAGVGFGLRRLTVEKVPTAAMVGAVFFVACLIKVPFGLSSVHLVLGGLAGWLLGFAAFPSLFVALLLQAVFLGFGGLTVLGVNSLILAGPAVVTGVFAQRWGSRAPIVGGFLAGSLSLVGSVLLCAAVLGVSGEAFMPLARTLLWIHLPVVLIEGLVTAGAAVFMARVHPQALQMAQS